MRGEKKEEENGGGRIFCVRGALGTWISLKPLLTLDHTSALEFYT